MLIKIIRNYLFSLWVRYKGNPVKQRRAIRQANRLTKKTGRRYRVFFIENRYQVLTRSDIQRKKHEHTWGWHVNATSLDPYCFYDTNDTLNL